jgi:proline iminopeptidase
MAKNENGSYYKKGYISVSDKHKLYYELYGNPKGIPVIFLHGGPGAGFSDKDKTFFNKRRYNVILFDQRGSSRSKPFGSIKNNTTQDLVNDIDRILDHLKFDKVYVFGGSWGSTLALVYAIHNPGRVKGLILRGIWLSNKYSIDHYLGGGIKEYYPDVWDRFSKLVKKGEKPADYYLKKMFSANKKESDKYAYEWAYYEMSFYTIRKIENTEDILHTFSYKSLAILEAHFIKNNCFLPEDFIMKNIKKIRDIPVAIVHGRFDFICTPVQAFRLHAALKNSTLNIMTAGHSGYDKENFKRLKTELKRITTI